MSKLIPVLLIILLTTNTSVAVEKYKPNFADDPIFNPINPFVWNDDFFSVMTKLCKMDSIKHISVSSLNNKQITKETFCHSSPSTLLANNSTHVFLNNHHPILLGKLSLKIDSFFFKDSNVTLEVTFGGDETAYDPGPYNQNSLNANLGYYFMNQKRIQPIFNNKMELLTNNLNTNKPLHFSSIDNPCINKPCPSISFKPEKPYYYSYPLVKVNLIYKNNDISQSIIIEDKEQVKNALIKRYSPKIQRGLFFEGLEKGFILSEFKEDTVHQKHDLTLKEFFDEYEYVAEHHLVQLQSLQLDQGFSLTYSLPRRRTNLYLSAFKKHLAEKEN